jgi:hypothetical protein
MFNKLNEELVYLLVFHAYINKIQGSRSKIPSKNLVRQRCAEGYNSGVKGLIKHPNCLVLYLLTNICTQRVRIRVLARNL